MQPSAITFLTDVEGDGAYFDRFVKHSKLLAFRSVTPSYGQLDHRNGSAGAMKWNLGEWDEDYFPYDREIVFINDGDDVTSNSMLVYGGDVWDKGGADLYVMRQLLSLHRRYPNRVHFLMGNRDINKMRIVDELGLANDEGGVRLPRHEGVYWLKSTLCSGLPSDPDSRVPSESAAERLKWMLRKTMGSVDAFELRRKELSRERVAIMNGAAVSPAPQSVHANGEDELGVSVSDDEVAWSYMRSCSPVSGIMSQYLTRAKLAIRFGPVLYLHGALPLVSSTEGISFDYPTPWIKPRDAHNIKDDCKSLTEWINELNGFAANQVQGWKEYHEYCRGYPSKDCLCDAWATEGGYFNNTLAGETYGNLMQYGMGTLPDRSKTQSCVYNSWMHDGLPREDLFGSDDAMSELCKVFERDGIQVVISGHQPVGDAPWPIQIPRNGDERKLWIIPCDTSFSGDTKFTAAKGFDSTESESLGRGSATSGRGEVAFNETMVQFFASTGKAESVTMHGCLSDGSYYQSENILDTGDGDNPQVGQKFGHLKFSGGDSDNADSGMFWAKGKVGEDQLLVSYGKGFNVWNAYIKGC